MNKKKLITIQKKTKRNYINFLKSLKRKSKLGYNSQFQKRRIDFYKLSDKRILEIMLPDAFKDFKEIINPLECDFVLNIPKNFCLCENYNDAMGVIISFVSTLYYYPGRKVTLDFSYCEKTDTSALFIIQILRLEFIERLTSIQTNLSVLSIVPDVKVEPPKSKDVLRQLLINGYGLTIPNIEELSDDTQLVPLDMMGYVKGRKSQKHYLENKKSKHTQTVVEYLNKCLTKFGYSFDPSAINNIEGIIGEVLSNAEDHGHYNTWFMTANLSKEFESVYKEDGIGEVNLTILNFGKSMYNTFLETQFENKKTFDQLDGYSNHILSNNKCEFGKEQLFTLGMMQDQISRLKYLEESRGTGTMKFINSFLSIGDFIDEAKGYYPNLSIFTGNSQLICDHKVKPIFNDGIFLLPLNAEGNIKFPPDNNYLIKNSFNFPGTLISVKIYFSSEHLNQKYGGDYSHD